MKFYRCQNNLVKHASPLKFVVFSFINPIIMIARFVELHKKEEYMVFHCVSYIKMLVSFNNDFNFKRDMA